ncbi:MAG: hypothetical protein ACXWC9_11015, partial [Pseudobdellovibrionaceae bacterium]
MNILDLPWSDYDQNGHALFIYNLDELKSQARKVYQHLSQFSTKTDIAFSLKSNPHPLILQCLMKEIAGFDVSSELEL